MAATHTTDLQNPELRELRARRLIAQRLTPERRPEDATEVARWMLATQGQLYGSGVEAIRVRGGENVAEGVDKHCIVRTWSQRGTHHFLAAEDAQWMMRLCSPRIEAAAEKRRGGLGLTPEMFQTARQTFEEALAKGPVTRKQAYELFDQAGVDPAGGRGPHILRSLGSLGEIVQGPRTGQDDTFMLVSTLPMASKQCVGDEALAEIATRYYASHGPATPKDLAWWSGLGVTAAKKATKLARDVTSVKLAGIEYSMGAWQLDVEPSELEAALDHRLELPAFDEYLLGYADRSAVCPPELVPVVGPTKNGMCRPFVVEQGIVVSGMG